MNSMEAPRFKQTYFVYTLADLDEFVFYVGKGTGDRIKEHFTEARRGCSCRKCKQIRAIWEQGNHPITAKIFETTVERDAFAYEWIAINMIYSYPQLTNRANNIYYYERNWIREMRRWHNSEERIERYLASYSTPNYIHL